MSVTPELEKLMLLSSQALWPLENSAVAHIRAMANRLKTSARGQMKFRANGLWENGHRDNWGPWANWASKNYGTYRTNGVSGYLGHWVILVLAHLGH